MPKRHLDELVAHHPHDGLVRRIFTKPEAAAAELRLALAPALVARLDWDSLRVEPGSFVDAELRRRSTDILYSIALRGSRRRVLVYVLLEHQSALDRLMALRLLIYAGRIWERWRAEHADAKSVPLLVPLLLFHGPRGWTMPRRLSRLYDLPEDLAAQLEAPIDLCFGVDQLEPRDDDQAPSPVATQGRGAVLAEVARRLLWLSSHVDDPLRARVQQLVALIDQVGEQWGHAELQTVLTYLVSVFGARAPELRAILSSSASQETRQVYTAMIEELIAEGRVEGRAEGRVEGAQEGRAAALLVVLEGRGFTLPADARRRIETCTDPRQLETWLRRGLTAASLDEVLGSE